MSKFTTDELLEKLYDHWKYKMYADGMKHDNEYRDAIIARLKAADALLSAAKTMEIDVKDYEAWQRPCYALDALRKAIADYEETE